MDTRVILPNLPQAAKLLFIRLRSLGDTILSTPLYTALKMWRPDLRISVLVEQPYDQILLDNPDLESVLSIPGEDIKGAGRWAVRLKTIQTIRAGEFDCCINLHGGSTSSLLTGLSGSPYRVGLESFRYGFCYNVRIEPPVLPDRGLKLHTVQYQNEWLQALGLPLGDIPPMRLIPNESLEMEVARKLAGTGINLRSSYAVIQPTSKFLTKEWSPGGFAEISDFLKLKLGCQTLLVGGPNEDAKLRRVSELCHYQTARLSNLSLPELVWVIGKARLFIGNDSGPTHLAAALQVPLVVLFGSSDSRVWYPWKVRYTIVQNPFECNPCPGYRCLVYDKPKCILSITAAQVKSAIERLLDETSQ